MKTLFCCLYILQSIILNVQDTKECILIKNMLSQKETISRFKFIENKDSLVLIDKYGLLIKHCNMIKVNDFVITVLYDSLLIKQLNRFDPYYILRDRCNMYLVNEYEKKGKLLILGVLQPCSGEMIRGTYEKIRGKFILKKLESIVL